MSKPKKQPLSRATLENNGIFFFEDLGSTFVPPHIESLRTNLRDTNCSLAQRLGIYDQDEPDLHDNTVLKDFLACLGEGEQTQAKAAFEALRNTKDRATRLHRGRDREREWVTFYATDFLSPLSKQIEISDKDSRRVSRAKYYYEYFEHAEDRPWTLFTEDFRREYKQNGLTQPKPDYVAYFPIYDFDRSSERIANRSQRWNWAMWPLVDVVGNFSRKSLESLTAHGLRPSVAKIFSNGLGRIEPSDCICYPWLIVEHKRLDQAKEIECYCQAANAAAAELLMFRILVKHADYQFVPPVVTMTTVGKYVRIWIAYFEAASEEYNMVCIWKGDMTTAVSINELESILENVHTWAMRTLRPWISQYLDQWKYHIQLDQENSDENHPSTVGNRRVDQESGLVLRLDHDSAPQATHDWKDSQSDVYDRIADLLKKEIRGLTEKIDSLITSRHTTASPSQTGPARPSAETGSTKMFQTTNDSQSRPSPEMVWSGPLDVHEKHSGSRQPTSSESWHAEENGTAVKIKSLFGSSMENEDAWSDQQPRMLSSFPLEKPPVSFSSPQKPSASPSLFDKKSSTPFLSSPERPSGSPSLFDIKTSTPYSLSPEKPSVSSSLLPEKAPLPLPFALRPRPGSAGRSLNTPQDNSSLLNRKSKSVYSSKLRCKIRIKLPDPDEHKKRPLTASNHQPKTYKYPNDGLKDGSYTPQGPSLDFHRKHSMQSKGGQFQSHTGAPQVPHAERHFDLSKTSSRRSHISFDWGPELVSSGQSSSEVSASSGESHSRERICPKAESDHFSSNVPERGGCETSIRTLVPMPQKQGTVGPKVPELFAALQLAGCGIEREKWTRAAEKDVVVSSSEKSLSASYSRDVLGAQCGRCGDDSKLSPDKTNSIHTSRGLRLDEEDDWATTDDESDSV